MNYKEKQEKSLGDRGNALSSLISSKKEKEKKEDELDFYYTYLFGGDGDNIGVINILELYYKELNLGIGRTTDRPSLEGGIGSSKDDWDSAFKKSLRNQGDDEDGFYPPDENNIGQKEINEKSNYFTTNADQGETEGGIIPKLINNPDIIDAIGEEASNNDDGRGPFDTLSEAESHRDSTKGSGILGKRTENSEIYSNYRYYQDETATNDQTDFNLTFDYYNNYIDETIRVYVNDSELSNRSISVDDDTETITYDEGSGDLDRTNGSFNFTFDSALEDGDIFEVSYVIDEEENGSEEVYYVGENGIDNPDWYNDGNVRDDFENSLISLRNDLEDYISHLNDIQNYLEYIENGEHEVFEEADMSKDMPTDDIAEIEDLKAAINEHIDGLYIDYFEGFTGSDDISDQSEYERNEFEDRIKTKIPNELNDIKNTLQERESDVKDAINYDDAEGSFRKWIVFWIKQAIGKTDGAMVALQGIKNNAIPDAENNLKNANEGLETLFGDKYDEYLLQPEVFAAFYNPEIDDDTGETIQKRAGIVWEANLGANRYNIYKRNISDMTSLLSNKKEDQWDDSYLIKQFTELNDEGSMIKAEYEDDNYELSDNGIFVYRVQSFDTSEDPKSWERTDKKLSKDTNSLQSLVAGAEREITSIDGREIKVDEKVEGSYGACFIHDVGDQDGNSGKYYPISKIKEKKITLTKELDGSSSKITFIIGSVFVPE